MERFKTHGQRVVVTQGELTGMRGYVHRKLRRDDSAWIRMDSDLPEDLRSFMDGDERCRDVVLWPEDCEQESAVRIPMEKWGRDHWSTLAYLGTRAADHSGTVARQHMRCNEGLHPDFAHTVNGTSPTRLNDGTEVEYHDDWSCAEDAEACGLLRINTIGKLTRVEFTDAGLELLAELTKHKVRGGSFGDFVPAQTTPSA